MGTKADTQRSPSLLSLLSAAALLYLLPEISAVNLSNPKFKDSDFIRSSCNVTLYPDLCYTSLSCYSNTVQRSPAQLASIAVGVSLFKARSMASYVSKLTHQAISGAEPRAVAALKDCLSTFDDAVDQIRRSRTEMRRTCTGESFMFQMSNVQTWMSAALTNEDTCLDGFDEVSDCPIKSDVCDRVSKVKKFTSNALALVNSYVAKVANATGLP